jgi:hypothetical protein
MFKWSARRSWAADECLWIARPRPQLKRSDRRVWFPRSFGLMQLDCTQFGPIRNSLSWKQWDTCTVFSTTSIIWTWLHNFYENSIYPTEICYAEACTPGTRSANRHTGARCTILLCYSIKIFASTLSGLGDISIRVWETAVARHISLSLVFSLLERRYIHR